MFVYAVGMTDLPPRPLARLGNTCYFNVVLQVLSRYGSIKHYFVDKTAPINEGPLTSEFRNFMSAQWDANRKGVELNPGTLLNKVSERNSCFKGRRQQDSHELLRVLLETFIEEERTRCGNRTSSALVKLLEGKIVCSVICRICKTRTERLEPFLDIPLSLIPRDAQQSNFGEQHSGSQHKKEAKIVPTQPPRVLARFGFVKKSKHTASAPNPPSDSDGASCGYKPIEGCLEEFIKPVTLEKENAYWCDECTRRSKVATALAKQKSKTMHPLVHLSRSQVDKLLEGSENINQIVKTTADRLTMVRESPDVLILYLVRFSQQNGLLKVSGQVSFPMVLDLSPFIEVPSGSKKPPRNTYALVGTTNHSGSLSDGHYTNYVRAGTQHDPEGAWYFCNDNRIKLSNKAQMLNSEAYLLFYERISK